MSDWEMWGIVLLMLAFNYTLLAVIRFVVAFIQEDQDE